MPGYVIGIAPTKSTRGGTRANFCPPPKLQQCGFSQVKHDTPTYPALLRRGCRTCLLICWRRPPGQVGLSRQSGAEQGKKVLSPHLHRKVPHTSVDKPQQLLEVQPGKAEKEEVSGQNLAQTGYPQQDWYLVDKLHRAVRTTCG